ncbi:hypothetical protein [Mesorhizobium sp. J428]|uniref:hypothetical protein n=1 Tax=Mesorhizobium sp. J428 TaxID=2898440 RepID=UPI002150C037|nr:hypothetical protein [Mesorhizobium sp. J428]MCR5858289.1 hypothetical protein [Mesorhizobium sp. J428]
MVEYALQILTIFCATFVLIYRPWSKSTQLGFAFFFLLLAIGFGQLIPLPFSLLESSRPIGLLPYGEAGSATILAPISLSVSRTLEATVFAFGTDLVFLCGNKLG